MVMSLPFSQAAEGRLRLRRLQATFAAFWAGPAADVVA